MAAFRLPAVIGHRGAAAYAPENTLEGIREAARRGARWVEFDAKLTGDGVVILMHDDTLDRTTNGRGPVAQASYREIGLLDAGAWFGAAWRGTRVPRLADALALLVESGYAGQHRNQALRRARDRDGPGGGRGRAALTGRRTAPGRCYRVSAAPA